VDRVKVETIRKEGGKNWKFLLKDKPMGGKTVLS